MGWILLSGGPYGPPAWSRRVLLRLTSGPLDALGPSLPPPGPSRQEWGTAEPGVSWVLDTTYHPKAYLASVLTINAVVERFTEEL
jgi:hypothetical protein